MNKGKLEIRDGKVIASIEGFVFAVYDPEGLDALPTDEKLKRVGEMIKFTFDHGAFCGRKDGIDFMAKFADRLKLLDENAYQEELEKE